MKGFRCRVAGAGVQVPRTDLSAHPASSLASLHCGTPSQARPAGRQSEGREAQGNVVFEHLGKEMKQRKIFVQKRRRKISFRS